jgi:glycosyltransferase involved in cell wall biosynthesis
VGKGRGNEEERLVAASLKKGFGDALVMAGWVEPAELPDYLAAGDVAIYPFADTLVNRAKCPAKLTELLRAGVPVVADCVGQIPEYFAPELHALLCAPDNWDEMAEKCVELLRDGKRRRITSSAERAYILDRFTWRCYVELLHNFLQKCLATT